MTEGAEILGLAKEMECRGDSFLLGYMPPWDFMTSSVAKLVALPPCQVPGQP